MTTRQKQKWLREVIGKWQTILYLENWSVLVRLEERSPDDTPNETVNASMLPDLVYKNATLTVFDSFWRHDDETREQILVHEMTHILTQPMRQLAIDITDNRLVTWPEFDKANESETEWVSGIIWRLYLNSRLK